MKARYFDSHYAQIEQTIEFKEEWANGTSYFDGAVWTPLQPGELAKSVDPYGRKIILVGTRYGTCVFFERYARQDPSDELITVVSNTPARVRSLVTDGNIGYDEFSRCVTKSANIGTAIEKLFSDFKRFVEEDQEFATIMQEHNDNDSRKALKSMGAEEMVNRANTPSGIDLCHKGGQNTIISM